VPALAAAGPGALHVLYSDAQQRAWVLEGRESISISLSRGQSDLITIVPLAEVKGLGFAPIGARARAFSCRWFCHFGCF
jgi:hypothetical protein